MASIGVENRAEISPHHQQRESERFVLIPVRAFAGVINALYKVAGPAAGGPLYFLGKNMGQGLAEEIKARGRRPSSLKEAAKLLADMLEELGFGHPTIEETEEDRAFIVIRDAPSPASAKLIGGEALALAGQGKSCYIEAGVVAGALETLLNRYITAKELPSGSDACRIEVRATRIPRQQL